MEVYINDMLVKSLVAGDHIKHLTACFKSLNEYGMKLNPTKCTFAVTSGELLGYIGYTAIAELPYPKTTREVQRLIGRIAALNRFISRSTHKCLPFYQLLRNNKRFEWDARYEDAFQDLKEYLSTPPILAKPEDRETLYLYIFVSTSAVSSVLVREDRGEQRPIFYTSKIFDDAETRYSPLEKLALAVVVASRKLRPYFQSHTIHVLTNHPLRLILHSPSQSARMAKWAVELSDYLCPKTMTTSTLRTGVSTSTAPHQETGQESAYVVYLPPARSSSNPSVSLFQPPTTRTSTRLSSPAFASLKQ
ncbi:hypothetical protein N665_0228s0001 [Sinapis alba]|nr:hypothetical protein N665_0228s0001 [Sinapis alba]